MDLTREERDRLLARKLPLIEKLNEQINRRQHEIMADDRLAANGHPNTQRSTSSYPNRRTDDNPYRNFRQKKKPVTLTPPPSPPKYNFLRDYRYDDSLDTIDNSNGKCMSKTTHAKSSNNSQQGHPNLTRDKFNNLHKSNNNSYDVSKNRNHLADYTAIKKASIKPLFPQGFAGNNQPANSFFKKRSKTSTELTVAMTHKPSHQKDNSIPPNDNESLNRQPQINKAQKSCRRHRRARHAAQGDRNFLIRTAYISIEDLTNTPSTSSRSESTPKRDNIKDRPNNLKNEKQLPMTENPRHKKTPSKAPIVESALQNSLKSLSLTPNTNGIQDSFNRLQVSGGVFPLLDTPEYNIFDRVMNTDNNSACLITSDLTELEKELIREILLEDPFDNNDKDPENGAQNMAADELYHQFIRSNSSQPTNNKLDKEVNADNVSDTTECESCDCVSSPNNPIYSRLFRDIYDGHAEHKLTKGLRNNSENSSIDEEAPPKFIWDSAADIDSYLTT